MTNHAKSANPFHGTIFALLLVPKATAVDLAKAFDRKNSKELQ